MKSWVGEFSGELAGRRCTDVKVFRGGPGLLVLAASLNRPFQGGWEGRATSRIDGLCGLEMSPPCGLGFGGQPHLAHVGP